MSPTPKSGGKPPARLDPREKEALVRSLRHDAERIAEHFGFRYRALEAENARVKARYGSFDSDGVIKIRLTHARTGKPLRYSSMVDTLCHELAHVRYFHHGPRFRALYDKVLEWARGEGIYRPTPRGMRPVTVPTIPDLVVASTARGRKKIPPKGAKKRRKRPGPEQLGLFG
jgi:hypothetical protein